MTVIIVNAVTVSNQNRKPPVLR